MKIYFFFICMLLGLTACTPRQRVVSQNIPSAVSQEINSEDARLAEFLGNAFEGETQFFSESRLGGNISVTAGRPYVSALNEKCREGTLNGRSRRRVAACSNQDGNWYLAPDIFDDGAI